MTTFDTHVQAEMPPLPVRGRVWRIEVHPASAQDDALGRGVRHEAEELNLGRGLRQVSTARVYLIEGDFDAAAIERVAGELLTDPVNQRYHLGASPCEPGAATIEVHYLPGVMDPVAESTRDAIVEMLGEAAAECQVRTGFRYDLHGVAADQADVIARRLLANTVIQSITDHPHWPERFVAGTPYALKLIHVPIRDLDDEALMRLSRQGHLFLSLDEVRTIRDHYRQLDREPTDIELETLAQTWSEHCVHKTLKSKVRYRELGEGEARKPGAADWVGRPGHSLGDDGALHIDNLLKSTIAAATHALIRDGIDWCVSVFVDNAGVIRFDEQYAVTFKVETHNHPSAIEPYGGAATGVGGCIRDTMGTGLGAKPIANTDVFCVANPTLAFEDLPKGVLHPRRVLKQVMAGVRDYGNRMGIPTVNGAVWFDDHYLGNPLVFCGSVGLIPLDKCFGGARAGDRIIAIGGATGRDGIHGATFSSAELTDTHADEFSHAVQIGNAITEKKVLDVILQARDHESGCLYTAITDCGAGGFSSAVGEMGGKLGAVVQLDRAPLKYEGLSYTEIWISEAQERMVLAVPPEQVDTLMALCEAEDVQACDLGEFGTEDQQLILRYGDVEVGRMSMRFLHDGIPQPTREAVAGTVERVRRKAVDGDASPDHVRRALLALLAHPNIASKHWIIRQYDHEVQGGSVVKPLVGEHEDGPSDAAVLRPRLDSHRAISLSCGLATLLSDVDAYWMVLAAIDEAVRNAVAVGARPDRIAILDNFCWPKCDRPENLAALVRAAEACYDGALAYRTPFISGKDSLNNEFTTEAGRVIAIPPTLLISAIGIVDDARRCVTMDLKRAGNLLVQVGHTTEHLGASHYELVISGGRPGAASSDIPRVDVTTAPGVMASVAKLIAGGHVRSAHDCSDGGMLIAAAEMAIAGRLGLSIDLDGVPRRGELPTVAACFAETPSRFLLEIAPEHFDAAARTLTDANVPFGQIGVVTDEPRVTVRSGAQGRLADVPVEDLYHAWRKPLDW